MQSGIIAMFGMMNYMYNNIEILNNCNLYTNRNSGKKSDDNKKKTYRADLYVQIKMEVSKQLSKCFLC